MRVLTALSLSILLITSGSPVVCQVTADSQARAAASANLGGNESAAPDSKGLGASITEIDQISHSILLKEIAFERYYTSYRAFASLDPRFRHLRYFLLQEAAAALSVANNVLALSQLEKHIKNPEAVHQQVIKRSVKIGLIGVIFEGGSSAFELGSNVLIALKNKRRKVDPESTIAGGIVKLKEIDNLIEKRSVMLCKFREENLLDGAKTGTAGDAATGLVAPSNSVLSRLAIFEKEGLVIKSFRDWCVYEFADVFADAHSYQASNSAYFAMDAAASAVYAASYLLSLRSFKRENLFGPSAIVGVVGDTFGIASAPGSSLAYSLLYKHWHRQFYKRMGAGSSGAESLAKKKLKELESVLAQSGPEVLAECGASVSRAQVFRIWSDRYDEFVQKRTISLRRLSRVALQSNITGPAISAGFLAQDVMGLVGAYSLKHNPQSANALSFASYVPVVVAAGTSLGFTTGWYVGDHLHERHLKKHQALPAELIDQRLRTLDELEVRLKASP